MMKADTPAAQDRSRETPQSTG